MLSLLNKLVTNASLNSLHSEELRFLHLLLTRMLQLAINLYSFKETIINSGNCDSHILGRKVPLVLWQAFYRACKGLGLKDSDLLCPKRRRSAWIQINSDVKLVQALLDTVMASTIKFNRCIIYPNILVDGNSVFNVLSVLPSRLIMCLSFCLLHWGEQTYEYWVRTFSTKVFILYLLLSGKLIPKASMLQAAANMNYAGLTETIITDLLATRGLNVLSSEYDIDIGSKFDFLFLFDNSVIRAASDDGDSHRKAPEHNKV